MKSETEITFEGTTARIRTTDPDVLAELEALPDARAVDADGGRTYTLSREALQLHLPHLQTTGDG